MPKNKEWPGPYSIDGRVEMFERAGGWYYISVPTQVSDELEYLADRGVIAIRAAVGDIEWDTSLLPMGDGTHFVALAKSVRQKAKLALGEELTLTISVRER